MVAERIINQENYSRILSDYLAAKTKAQQTVILEPAPASPKRTLRIILFSRSQPLPTTSSRPLSVEEETKKLEDNFKHQVYSNRKLLVCHLKANLNRQEQIITDYLGSPELLSDRETFGQLLGYWLLEFFQQTNTGELNNLLRFIRIADPAALPRDLQRSKKEVFDPIFKLLGTEFEALEKTRYQSIFQIGREIADTIETIPNSAIQEYHQYVKSLVGLETGSANETPEKSPHEILGKRNHLQTATRAIAEEILPEEQSRKLFYSFLYVSSSSSSPISISDFEEFKACAEKIKGFGNVPPEDVWSKLQKLTTMTPREISIHYRDKVSGGPFKGWTQIHIGSTLMRIIFSVDSEKDTITFKIGQRGTIYETVHRTGRDKSRSL